jgi:hypothetical protein
MLAAYEKCMLAAWHDNNICYTISHANDGCPKKMALTFPDDKHAILSRFGSLDLILKDGIG